MSPESNQRSTRITVVTAPGCHFCEDAHQTLTQMATDGAAITVDARRSDLPIRPGSPC